MNSVTYLVNQKMEDLREKNLKKSYKPKCSLELYKTIVDANIKYIELARELFNVEFELPIIRCDITGRNTCGWAMLKTNVVNYNPSYFELDLEHHLKETVGHEIAHIVAFILYNDEGHGKMWKYVMRKFGLEPERTLTSTSPKPEPVRVKKVVLYKCDCRTYEIGQTKHNNLLKNPNRYMECRHCNSRLTFKG